MPWFGERDHAASSPSLRSTSFPFTTVAPARTSAARCGALTFRHPPQPLKKLEHHDEPPRAGSLVTSVQAARGRTLDSMAFGTVGASASSRLLAPEALVWWL